ncbi:hypothetical protein ACLM5H_12885 [Fredinandcohnia humi]
MKNVFESVAMGYGGFPWFKITIIGAKKMTVDAIIPGSGAINQEVTQLFPNPTIIEKVAQIIAKPARKKVGNLVQTFIQNKKDSASAEPYLSFKYS